MTIHLPVKASGRTLTAGDVSEALSGLDDCDPVTVNGLPVLDADPSAGGLDFDFGHDCEKSRARDALAQMAEGKMTKKEMVEAAKEFVDTIEAPQDEVLPGLVA